MSDSRKGHGEEHASRPGPISFAILAGLIVLYFVVGYKSSIETFLGIQF